MRNSSSLLAEVKERQIKLAGKRVTEDGILLIEAKRYRTQEQNRLDAVIRLVALVERALEPIKIHRQTRHSRTGGR